jgi:hypothetical protein
MDMFSAMEIHSYFDYLGVRLNAERARDKAIVLNWVINGMPADKPVNYTTNLSNSALTYREDKHAENPDATLTLERSLLNAINGGAGAGTAYTSQTLEVKYLRPITRDTGSVRADSVVIHRGRKTATAEAKLTSVETGKLLATGTSTCLLFEL